MRANAQMRNPPHARPSSPARAPVLGAAFGLLLVLGPMAFGVHGFLILFSLGGLAIVVGGVIAVAFMSFAADDVHKALAAVVRMFRDPEATHEDLRADMANILRWARLIKERGRQPGSGIDAEAIADSFAKYGLNMALSDYPPEEVRRMLETAADAAFERDSKVVDILHAMTSHAPAFGMVGTLIGMVTLLGNLGDGISGVAPSLAVAFLSTLYGVLSARMVYMPAAARLQQELERQRFRHYFIGEGITLLAARKPPIEIQDRLNSFLRPDLRDYFDCFEKRPAPAARPRLRAIGS
ncbi:MAG TPA: MotA/TolQ/ExbB proton channel family protein [Stellaceae bacterium]|nr:MotA/TolQ/ExbB proton channel family protein [Stellaceae bacterium]